MLRQQSDAFEEVIERVFRKFQSAHSWYKIKKDAQFGIVPCEACEEGWKIERIRDLNLDGDLRPLRTEQALLGIVRRYAFNVTPFVYANESSGYTGIHIIVDHWSGQDLFEWLQAMGYTEEANHLRLSCQKSPTMDFHVRDLREDVHRWKYNYIYGRDDSLLKQLFRKEGQRIFALAVRSARAVAREYGMAIADALPVLSLDIVGLVATYVLGSFGSLRHVPKQ